MHSNVCVLDILLLVLISTKRPSIIYLLNIEQYSYSSRYLLKYTTSITVSGVKFPEAQVDIRFSLQHPEPAANFAHVVDLLKMSWPDDSFEVTDADTAAKGYR